LSWLLESLSLDISFPLTDFKNGSCIIDSFLP
jgi:hypothetical protein